MDMPADCSGQECLFKRLCRNTILFFYLGHLLLVINQAQIRLSMDLKEDPRVLSSCQI